MSFDTQEWWPLSRFFNEAERLSISRQDAADKLLVALTQPGNACKASGFRRVTDYGAEPPRPFPVSSTRDYVPQDLWANFDGLAGGRLHKARDTWEWIDDPDEPEAFGKIDWAAGLLEFFDYFVVMEYGGGVEFLDIRIDPVMLVTAFAEAKDEVDRTKPSKHTEEDRLEWIRQRGRSGGMDIAFAEYREHPMFDGTKQPEFRRDWRKVFPDAKRGRPPIIRQ